MVAACGPGAPAGPPRTSGYVEATEVRVAARVGGRVDRVLAVEGDRVTAGTPVVTLLTTEIALAIDRATAERAQAVAQLRLLEAGPRDEDRRQAEAQVTAARSDQRVAEADLAAARVDEARFEQLVRERAGTTKQRDDAVARREVADARVTAAADRVAVAEATLARVSAPARRQELDAAAGRVAAVNAQIALLQHDLDSAAVVAPTDGVVATRLVEPGELVAPGQPLLVVIDLDRAWANAFVPEPLVPALRIGAPATVITDGGDRLAGEVTFISSKAEFTPRNVQTAEERAKLVYRVKVTVDNRDGVLKPGMPVEVEFQAGG
jgi:HlyD family secretion protein